MVKKGRKEKKTIIINQRSLPRSFKAAVMRISKKGTANVKFMKLDQESRVGKEDRLLQKNIQRDLKKDHKMSQGQHKSKCPRIKNQRSKTQKATERKDEMHKMNAIFEKFSREKGSKKTEDIGLLLSVPKWGGKFSIGHQLWNTCTIDNFLTIMHVTSMENPDW